MPPGARRPLVMGVLNVTPDSFSDGGLYATVDAAVARGLDLMAAGADLVDHVRILRVLLHGPRPPAHVHRHPPGAGGGGHFKE